MKFGRQTTAPVGNHLSTPAVLSLLVRMNQQLVLHEDTSMQILWCCIWLRAWLRAWPKASSGGAASKCRCKLQLCCACLHMMPFTKQHCCLAGLWPCDAEMLNASDMNQNTDMLGCCHSLLTNFMDRCHARLAAACSVTATKVVAAAADW